VQLIAATGLLGFPELVTALGADAADILTPVGLRVTDCGDPDIFIPLRRGIHAVERAATHTGRSDFGRLLAEHQGIEILGAVGVAARTADTVGAALVIFDRFMAAYSPGIAVGVHPGPTPRTRCFTWQLLLQPPVKHAQTAELSLGIMLRVLRTLLGSGYRPEMVHIPHAALGDPLDYLAYYGCEPVFGSGSCGFTVQTRDLDRPLADQPDIHQAAMAYLATVFESSPVSVSSSVAALVRPLLPGGTVAVDLIAAQFGLHHKTLQRRLASEGTSFSRVVDQVRCDIAARYLRDTDITLVHLTRQLGFAEPAVLTRACRRWFGVTPSRYRDASRRQA